jgi:hypothetical protein
LLKADKITVGALLATMALAGLLAAIVALFFISIPAGNKDFLNICIMTLVSCVSTAFGYFLGSSLGSSKKDEIINKINVNPIEEVDGTK